MIFQIKRFKIHCCAWALSLLSGLPVGAQTLSAEQLKMESLAATCASCHGTQGRSNQDDPSHTLAGKPEADLLAQLTAFKNGQRPATIMHQIAKGYSDTQLEALARYFGAIKDHE